jgi:hypothetical protein
VDASNVTVFKGPVQKTVTGNAAASTTTVEITFLGLNNNGTVGVSSRQQGAWAIGHGLTVADQKVLANVMNQLNREFRYGGLDTYEAGYLPSSATYDVIVYGATSGGVIAAYEAARQGLSVAIVGGWRDRNIGGMSTAGLGYTDFDSQTALQGLPRWVLAQVQAAQSTASTVFQFDPAVFEQVLRGMFDPAKPNGLDIPVYWSNGVVSVSKTGTTITSLTTADGRTFTANTGFVDASYEGDLCAVAGCTMIVGREAAGSGKEAINGFRGTNIGLMSATAQFYNHAGTNVNIDPWLTPGDTNSGLLPGIEGVMGTDSPATGAADGRVQAYNFRWTTAFGSAWRVPLPSTPPTGYAASRYEALGRLFANDPTLVLTDLIKQDNLPTVVADINTRNGLSTDMLGTQATTYATASYSARETIWKAHETYLRGFFYYLQYDSDVRVPSAVRTSALAIGLSMQHYTRPHPNDDWNWMPQLYVREGRRLVGDYIHNANDLAATDGTTPRSVKTVAVASYAMDSHNVSGWAHNNSGTWRIWNEGNLQDDTSGDTDNVAPVPIEALLPKAAEITNLASIFAVSATHIACASIRMEFSHMLMGQASACMMAERKANANLALQSLTYSALRTRLLASNTLSGETAPSLPQVN